MFKTYNENGQVLLDSQTPTFALIAISKLTRFLTTPFENNKREYWYRAKRLGVNSKMRQAWADIYTPEYNLYYVEVDAISPIVAIHYNGTMDNCTPFVYKNAETVNGKLRLVFYSNGRLSDSELDNYVIYVFDTKIIREPKVGINLYDKNGNVTFSNYAPLLNVNALSTDNIPKLEYNVPQLQEKMGGYYRELKQRLEDNPQADYLNSNEWQYRCYNYWTEIQKQASYIIFNDRHKYALPTGNYACFFNPAVNEVCFVNPELIKDPETATRQLAKYLKSWDGNPNTLTLGLWRELMLVKTQYYAIGCTDGILLHRPFTPSNNGGAVSMIDDWRIPIAIAPLQSLSYVNVKNM